MENEIDRLAAEENRAWLALDEAAKEATGRWCISKEDYDWRLASFAAIRDRYVAARSALVDALSSAVEDQERLNEAQRQVLRGNSLEWNPFAKQYTIVEYCPDEYLHTVAKGDSLRSALDAARTPTQESETDG